MANSWECTNTYRFELAESFQFISLKNVDCLIASLRGGNVEDRISKDIFILIAEIMTPSQTAKIAPDTYI